MPNLTEQLAVAMTDHDIDLMRYAAHVNRSVRTLLNALQGEIAGRLAKANVSASAQSRLVIVLRDVRKMIEVHYGTIDALMFDRLSGLVSHEAEALVRIVNTRIGATLLDGILPISVMRELVTDTLILGAPSSEWWLKQASNTTFAFGQEMRHGIAQGETNAQLVARVRRTDGLLDKPKKQAEALVRTSVQTIANAARVATMLENKEMLKGMQQVSTLDARTSATCIAYDLCCWDLEGEPIEGTTLPFVNEGGSPDGVPRHWNCRSSIIPIVKSWKDLGINIKDEFSPKTRASMDGQVSAKMSYSDWLASKSAEQQDEILGAGKAALWRSGKISAQNLLDQNGRPLSLAQLRATLEKGAE